MVCKMTGRVFKMMTQACRGGLNLSLCKRRRDFLPNFRLQFNKRPGIDRPAMKCEGGLCRDKHARLHLLGPKAVMRRNDELCIRKISLQKLAELVAVSSVHRHNDIVQERDREMIPEEPLHEREIKADPHTVLVALAMECGRRE